eukprot:354430-Chlamydomonas_euryale.AAC.6
MRLGPRAPSQPQAHVPERVDTWWMRMHTWLLQRGCMCPGAAQSPVPAGDGAARADACAGAALSLVSLDRPADAAARLVAAGSEALLARGVSAVLAKVAGALVAPGRVQAFVDVLGSGEWHCDV